jgi:predicted ribosome quality control (RQC) complex YloA/Tae2 family protein
MSNVDIFAICHELNNLLEGARVDKSFQPNKDTVIMRFHVKGTGRVDVVFQAGVRIHKTQYPLDNPMIPPSFPMLLRKKLKGGNVISIKQHNFDRVVEIKVKKEQIYTLVIELFAKGNIILLDEEKNIILPLKRKQWSDRDISSKKEYKYPPKKGMNLLELTKEELNQLLINSEDDLIRTLAKNGLGGVYAEEIVLKARMDKKIPSKDLNSDEISIIYDSIINIFQPLKDHDFKPNIVFKEKDSELNENKIINNNYNNSNNNNNNNLNYKNNNVDNNLNNYDINDENNNYNVNNLNNNVDNNLNNYDINDENNNYNVNNNVDNTLNKDSNDLNINININNDHDYNDINNYNNEDVINNRPKTTTNTNIEELNIRNNGKDVVPLKLRFYEGYKKEYFKLFNDACDEFFSSKVNVEIKSVQENVWNKKVNKFAKRLKLQEKTLEDFKNTIESSKEKGDLLYAYYAKIENLLNVISNARSKSYPWVDIAKTLKKAKKEGMKEAEIVESMDKLGNLILNIENNTIAIDSKKSIAENAEIYYERAKKAKRKIKGALIAIESTKKKLKDMENKKEIAMEKVMLPQKRVKKELKWFEKLRWFLSSDDILVVGGRDANTNEDAVKKYLDNNDIYLHADIHGAPSIVVKLQDKEVNENILKESAIFAASFSNAWSKNYGTQDVYWVHPDQVSKTPESGEFVSKGSFIIRGKKNYIRGVNLKIAIGIVNYEGPRVMAGPVDAIKKHTDNYVIIRPGYVKKEAIAKEILYKINKDNLISLDDVVRVLPSGKCEIIRE